MAEKKKFKLKDFLHKVRELTLLADVFIDGKEFKNYPLGTVSVRGVCDPVYLKRSIGLLEDFRESVTKDSTEKDLRILTEGLQLDSVVISLEGWDVDLFDLPFTQENARKVFSNPEYAIFFNQIAHFIEERKHFLPDANQRSENG